MLRTILAAGAIATMQRSALLALGCGGAVALWLRSRPVARSASGCSMRMWAAAPVAALPVLGAGSRMWSLTRLTGARFAIWEAAGRLVACHPILGVGPDMLYSRFLSAARYAYFVAEPPGVTGTTVLMRLPASAHNEIVSVAAAQGLPGLGIYLWVLLSAARAGASSALLPAITGCFAVHLTNPASTATAVIFWTLVAALASDARREDRSCSRPVSRSSSLWKGVAGAAMAVFLFLSLAVALRVGVAQAHRREAGRLAFQGRHADLAAHLDRWAAYAARVHPRHAHEDASLFRRMWEADPGEPGPATRAIALWTEARRENPFDIFYLSALADCELALGKRRRDDAALRRAEELLREALRRAPSALSLYDDLAGAVEARGRRQEGRRLRALRRELDVRGIFSPRQP
jgi:hypothetical protein